MRYYTKEWYKLMQQLDYITGMRAIADKAYTDDDIAALYARKLKADIKRDRDEYNTPPQPLEIDFDNCSVDDFVMFDEERGVLVRPQSIDEVKRDYAEQQARAIEQFEARPPFDQTETEQNFKRMYEGGLKYGYSRYPEWVRDRVDVRLIALGYLPKSAYDRLKAEQKANKAKFDRIERAAREALSAECENIPDEILQDFGFHDGEVIDCDKAGGNIALTIRADGVPMEGETPYVRITFVNGKILESDENLKDALDRTVHEGKDIYSYCTWLYDELYKTTDGYEAHMLLGDGELYYFTVACSNIIIEHNVPAPDIN